MRVSWTPFLCHPISQSVCRPCVRVYLPHGVGLNIPASLTTTSTQDTLTLADLTCSMKWDFSTIFPPLQHKHTSFSHPVSPFVSIYVCKTSCHQSQSGASKHAKSVCEFLWSLGSNTQTKMLKNMQTLRKTSFSLLWKAGWEKV